VIESGASLRRTADGGCPYMIPPTLEFSEVLDKGGQSHVSATLNCRAVRPALRLTFRTVRRFHRWGRR
jgi:hypothetical protein